MKSIYIISIDDKDQFLTNNDLVHSKIETDNIKIYYYFNNEFYQDKFLTHKFSFNFTEILKKYLNNTKEFFTEFTYCKILKSKSSLTPNDLLKKIKTVDGQSSGLDADTLDGLNSTDFAKRSETYNKTETNDLLTSKTNISDFNELKTNTFNKTEVNNLLTAKTNATDFNDLKTIAITDNNVNTKLVNRMINNGANFTKISSSFGTTVNLAQADNHILTFDPTNNTFNMTNGKIGQSGVIKIINAEKITYIHPNIKYKGEFDFENIEYFAYFVFGDTEILFNKC